MSEKEQLQLFENQAIRTVWNERNETVTSCNALKLKADNGKYCLTNAAHTMPVNEIKELKKRFIDQLSPLRIYLFGSYADGSYTNDSDFDFYIVVSDDAADLAGLTAQAYRSIRSIKRRPVDILLRTNSWFEKNKNKPSVENEVYQRGVLLYGSGERTQTS